MTNEERIALFETEINYISASNIQNFIKTAITCLPNYFFEVPASSSGKFHSVLECGFGGLVYHCKSVAKIANYLVGLDQYKNKLTETERDCTICAALLHDCRKHGSENKTGFSVFEHPILAAEFVKSDPHLDNIIESDLRALIADAIASHTGQWNTSTRSKTVLPVPQTLIQELVHLSDYIASRGDIHILFEDTEAKPQLPNVDEYVINFGKHSGTKLIDLFNNNRGYCNWLKENVSREPLISLIKLLEEQEKETGDKQNEGDDWV